MSHLNPANKRITFRPGTFSLEFVCAFVLVVHFFSRFLEVELANSS